MRIVTGMATDAPMTMMAETTTTSISEIPRSDLQEALGESITHRESKGRASDEEFNEKSPADAQSS
jgi:hypothetical protein